MNTKTESLNAAAPEMLKVLKAVCENWKEGGYTSPDDPRALARFTEKTIRLWKLMLAAIDKAEGRYVGG